MRSEDIGALRSARLKVAAKALLQSDRALAGRARVHPAAVNAAAICSREPISNRLTMSAGRPVRDFLDLGATARSGTSSITGARLDRSLSLNPRESSIGVGPESVRTGAVSTSVSS